MNSIEKIMFFTPMYYQYLTDIDNESLKNFIISLKESDPGREISNIGGWQSKDIDLLGSCNENKNLLNLVINLENMVEEIVELWGLKENIMLSNMWANINKKHDYNIPHSHPGSIFSGVYYVDCNASSGDIVFNRPDLQQHYILFKENNEYTYETHRVQPEQGKVLIFPSHLYHYVMPNRSDNERVSIAFNFTRVI